MSALYDVACGLWIFKALSLGMTFHLTKNCGARTLKSIAIPSSSTMLISFIIILVLWHQALPTSAVITDAEYRSSAESLREYRHGMTKYKKMQIEDELEDLYLKWKDPNDHYGSGITSVTELWIQNIIPEGTPFAVEDTRYQLNEKSPGRNEFVWEGLRTLDNFAYLFVDEVHREELEGLRALAATAGENLTAQLRSHFFPYVDVSNLVALSAEVARTYMGQEYPPCVSSLTQVELIKMNWLNWCVDELKVGEKLARSDEMHGDTPRTPEEKWVEALVSSQLAARRIALIQSELKAFNVQLKQKRQSSIAVAQLLNDMDVLGKAFAYYAEKYRSLTWKIVLGERASDYLGRLYSVLATPDFEYGHGASIQADPRTVEGIPDYVISLFHLLPTPENVPPEYLELAIRFHQLVVDRDMNTEGERNEKFKLIVGDAPILWQNYGDAYAASSPYSAGSTDDGTWAERENDANQLRRIYATAVD
ncbi:hypothetical protein SeLEV6574_g05671, partial [Synchytrium endobioticum]